jgi:hypothetical protein
MDQRCEGVFTCQGRVLYQKPCSYICLHCYAASHTRHEDDSDCKHQYPSQKEDNIDNKEGYEDFVIHPGRSQGLL